MRSNEHYPIRNIKRVKTEGKKANEVRTPLTLTKRAVKSNELRKPTGSDRSAGKAEGENVRR